LGEVLQRSHDSSSPKTELNFLAAAVASYICGLYRLFAHCSPLNLVGEYEDVPFDYDDALF
jgi:hypothetical protein